MLAQQREDNEFRRDWNVNSARPNTVPYVNVAFSHDGGIVCIKNPEKW